jgi:hypothetical protein
MTYFLLTGDEDLDLTKLENLLDKRKIPVITKQRPIIRMEAENFRMMEGYAVERGTRKASKRLKVELENAETTGEIRTRFNEIYALSGRYDVGMRFLDRDNGQCTVSLYVNGRQAGTSWRASQDNNDWVTHTLKGVTVHDGDEIKVVVKGQGGETGELDYIELSNQGSVEGSAAFTAAGPLDDPAALPGQVVVAGGKPGYLINTFMEQTDFYKMTPRDDLADGSTNWVLARPGDCYIAYTYGYAEAMGVKSLVAGTYDLMWFDTLDGDVVRQSDVSVPWGNGAWKKPASMSDEIVLYVKRQE